MADRDESSYAALLVQLSEMGADLRALRDSWDEWRTMFAERLDRHGTRLHAVEMALSALKVEVRKNSNSKAEPTEAGVPMKYVVVLVAAIAALAIALAATRGVAVAVP